LLPNDVLVCELPANATPSTAKVADAGWSCGGLSGLDSPYIFSTVTLEALQAARPAQPPSTPYKWLPNPVRLTPFITLVADNGAEVTLAVGDYQPMSLFTVTDPAPEGASRSTGFLQQIPTTLTWKDYNDTFKDNYESRQGWQSSVLVPGLLPVTSTCPGDAQFVSAICGTPGFSRCRPILGITQGTCLGAFSMLKTTSGTSEYPTLAERCSAACSGPSDPAVNAACRQVQTDHCTVREGVPGASSAALDLKPECACYRLNTSKVPATMVAGQPMTYGSTVSWFADNFGGGGVPSFLTGLPYIYPACLGNEPALTAYAPHPDVQECLELVKGVTVTNNSDVNITLNNTCSLNRSTTAANSQKPTPGTTPPVPIPPSKYIPGVVGTAVGTFILLVVICFVGVWQLRLIARSIAPKESLGGVGRHLGRRLGQARRGYHT
jgi:hypothetical protein